jgi:alpha-glucosidase
MDSLEKARQAIRFIGFAGVWNALRYSVTRDRLERRFPRPESSVEWTKPGSLQSVEHTESGARWFFEQTELEITFLAPDLVRCEWAGGDLSQPYALAGVEWRPVATHLHNGCDGWRLESDHLTVLVQVDGSISFYDKKARALREEYPPERRNGTWIHRAALRPEERIYGLGERASSLNLRGGVYRQWNRDPASTYHSGDDPLYLCIPVYLGLHQSGSYIYFHENPMDATFDVGATDPSTLVGRFTGGSLLSYLCAGSPAHALARYTELTGRPSLPPRWVLGYHQSRWGYRTEEDVRAVVEGFRQHELPLCAVHLDLDYMDGRRVFTVDRTRFPDLAKLSRELSMHGIHLVAIINPGVKWDPEYDVFQEGLAGGHFCTMPDGKPLRAPVWPGMCAFPDFTSAVTRAWWGRYYAGMHQAGIRGYWHDMNEPATFAAWGEMTLPRATSHHLEGRQGDHREAHNTYGLLQVRAAYEALRQQQPDQRPFIISRSGWAGLQRYAWSWTGDTVSTWEGLRQTIATVLGLGLSGMAYTGPDIGGFSGAPSAELFLRWFQMAAFMPFFRNHSALDAPRREPWVFGEPYLSILRKFLCLREQLVPYLYTLCWEAAQTGVPLVRPLFWLDESDMGLWDVDDAFLVGDDILLAPALEPNAGAREVVLPKGQWYSYWDDERLEGPGRAECAVTLERIPVLVRAGSVLPLAQDGRLVLHLYADPTGSGGGQIYSDAGDGYGPWRLDRFTVRRSADGITVDWQTQGEYPLPYTAVEVCLHGITAKQVRVDGDPLATSGQQFAVGVFRQLRFEADGE